MNPSRSVYRLLTILLQICVTICLFAQENNQSTRFVPNVGQAGKDVIWVPTPEELVKKMLEIAEVTEKDFVIDLGSGDGRMVIAAAKLGANAIGVEYNPEMVELSKRNAEKAGVSGKAKFIQSDLFAYDLSEGTVITMFLLPEINLKLRPRLLDLKPGTRIVSNTFTMGDWEPDIEVTTEENWNSWYTALMWIVPSEVEGTWKLVDGELTLQQKYQMIYGTFKSAGNTSRITDGRLNGSIISFNIDGAEYTGHVGGDNYMTGTMTTATAKSDWTAKRLE
jgi:SAM-dependent methyltransferase